jgi:hypothetical protein
MVSNMYIVSNMYVIQWGEKMVSNEPEEGKCNFPLLFKCSKCGKRFKSNETCECGGKIHPLQYCGNGAGKGTDHKGTGFCYHHDCNYESVSIEGRLKQALPNLRHGAYSKYFRNIFLAVHEEEILDILEMVKEDPDALLKMLTAKAMLLYSKTGDFRQAKIVIETMREMVQTEKERREKGLITPKEPEDLAEKIVNRYFEMREEDEKRKN